MIEYPLTTDLTPHRIRLHFFGPANGKYRWWAKAIGAVYTHVSLQLGDYIIDQPLTGPGDTWPSAEFLQQRAKEGRLHDIIEITALANPTLLTQVLTEIVGRKYQRVRTTLHYLGLWPWMPVNCITPALAVLAVMGIRLRERTPDGIYRILKAEVSRLAPHRPDAHSEVE